MSQLIPELVGFLATVAEQSESLKVGDPTFIMADEIIKILSAFVSSLDDNSSESSLITSSKAVCLSETSQNLVHTWYTSQR